MLLARLNLGLASEDQEEVDLYNHYQKNIYSEQNQQQQNLMNKEERRRKYKSMTSQERQELILKTMKDKGIEVGSGVPDKKYDSEEVYELIHIANCFPELREKDN
jgi:predicted phosphoribosyltransferase